MPKKTEKKSALELVSWIEGLPDAGGSWGKGIVETVTAFETEAEAADKEAARLDGEARVAKDKAAQRRSMAQQAARRAQKEAVKLYTEEVLTSASFPKAEAPASPPAS